MRKQRRCFLVFHREHSNILCRSVSFDLAHHNHHRRRRTQHILPTQSTGTHTFSTCQRSRPHVSHCSFGRIGLGLCQRLMRQSANTPLSGISSSSRSGILRRSLTESKLESPSQRAARLLRQREYLKKRRAQLRTELGVEAYRAKQAQKIRWSRARRRAEVGEQDYLSQQRERRIRTRAKQVELAGSEEAYKARVTEAQRTRDAKRMARMGKEEFVKLKKSVESRCLAKRRARLGEREFLLQQTERNRIYLAKKKDEMGEGVYLARMRVAARVAARKKNSLKNAVRRRRRCSRDMPSYNYSCALSKKIEKLNAQK